MTTNDEITDRIAFLLIVNGEAQVRTGDRRSTDAARKLLKAGAKQASVDISTSASDGFVAAVEK